MVRSLIYGSILLASAHATSVRPALHRCPVCGERSVTSELMSYSSFGEPARDLSDHPAYQFYGVEVCPSDLFAGWAGSWESLQAGEKAKLAEFLNHPVLNLTEAEKSIIAGDEDAFRESPWFLPAWARTCDGFRPLTDREKFNRILRTHYTGKFVERKADATDLETRLVGLYREQAISALKDSLTADWASPLDKRVHAYLRAELIRQAGRDKEAFALFQQVIDSESTLEPDEETSWILRWAREQSLRADPQSQNPARLIAIIIPELPDPWRNLQATEDPRWPLHHAAVDLLAQQASSGKEPFSDALWKLLDRKPPRLLALLETSRGDISALRQVDALWREWFDEIEALLDDNRIPPSMAGDPNPERVRNVLARAVEARVDQDQHDSWFLGVFLPAVRHCASEGGIPEIPIPEKRLYPNLSLSMPDDELTPEDPLPPPSLNQVSRALYELWEKLPAEDRKDVARVYVRILHRLGDDHDDSFDYPVEYFLPDIAATEAGREAICSEMHGEWESSFWKSACAYAARMENSGAALFDHPLGLKWGSTLIAKLAHQRADPGWKEAAMQKLKEDEWAPRELTHYLAGLDLPATRKALDDFMRETRTVEGKQDMMRLYTLEDLERIQLRDGLKNIPIR
jgi:hypothetical protein